MRQFDLWNRYLDLNNNPLHGCVQFNVRNGNTVAPIYDAQGTSLPNPILTDIYGRTAEQVFIDTDVTAYFYKYIGPGSFETITEEEIDIDVSDTTRWSLQYTVDNFFDYNISITANAVIAISTIPTLRSIDPAQVPAIDNVKTITLLGYNTVNDKEPINYYWDANSTETDNGGSIIKSNDLATGRWIMIQPTEHCDSRHFGVFPSNSSNMTDQSFGISRLFEYCLTHGIRPFFNGSDDYRWFKYTDINVQCPVVDIAKGTKFNDNGQCTITAEFNGDPYFANAHTSIIAKNVKTSWNAQSYSAYSHVDIDVDTVNKNWTNATVDITVSPATGFNFTNCVLSEHSNLTIGNTFTNCKLTSKMFNVESAVLTGKCTNCQLDVNDFRNAIELYRQARCTQDANPYFDYIDINNPGLPYALYTGNKLTSDTIAVSNLNNPLATKYTFTKIPTQTSLVLNNVTGWYVIPSGLTVIMNNCSVRLETNTNSIIHMTNSTVEFDEFDAEDNVQIVAYDSTIRTSYDIYAKTFKVNDCSVTANSINAETVEIDKSNVDAAIVRVLSHTSTTSKEVTYKSWDQSQTSTVTVNRFISGKFLDSRFNGTIVIDASYNNISNEETLVDELDIIRCNSTAMTPITVRSVNGAFEHDKLHRYRFIDNTGTFIYSQTVDCSAAAATYGNPSIMTLSFGGMLGAEALAQSYDGIYYDDQTQYFTTMKLFSIGTTDADLSVQVHLQTASGTEFKLIQTETCLRDFDHAVTLSTQAQFSSESTFYAADVKNASQYADATNPAQRISQTAWSDTWQIRNFILGQAVSPNITDNYAGAQYVYNHFYKLTLTQNNHSTY